jgi:hypothetical protein
MVAALVAVAAAVRRVRARLAAVAAGRVEVLLISP